MEFEVADARSFPGENYALIAFFDCFHDMGDPLGAATRACQTLAADGSLLMVEPIAGNTVEENFNPVGGPSRRLRRCAARRIPWRSAAPPSERWRRNRPLRETVLAGGFKHFRRATETPFNRIFEGRR